VRPAGMPIDNGRYLARVVAGKYSLLYLAAKAMVDDRCLSMLVVRSLNWRRLEWERRSGLNGGSQLEAPPARPR
jgi:hypothetical protein